MALLGLLLHLLPACAAGPAAYGAKVKFKKDAPLQFPDFTLTYTGERKVSGPVYPRGWMVYDFTVAAQGKTQKVSWTAGTGVIEATRFTVGGKAFDLELRGSRKHGWIGENELVVSPAN